MAPTTRARTILEEMMAKGNSSTTLRRATTLSLDQWSSIIQASIGGIVEGVIEIGQNLIQAKADHPGEFERMFKGHPEAIEHAVPFTSRTGRYLMTVAQHPVLADRKHASVLPPSWATLAELAKLPEPVLKKALMDGRVHPAMERHEVAALRGTIKQAVPRVTATGPARFGWALAGSETFGKLAEERQRREKEQRLIHDLALQLIDIGYKVLATKLHPDRGGSAEAMARLNSVRNLLRSAV